MHDGAEALGRADRLQAGDADAQDQDVGGLRRAGGGGQQREVARIGVGGDEDRLVAADVGLRRERVHRLRTAQRARDRVEADRGHARVRERLGAGRIDQRLEEADQRLALAQPTDLGRAGLLDLEHDIRLRVQGVRGDDRRAGVGERLVGDGGTGTGALLDEDLQPGSRELAERLGHQGDTALAGGRLPGDADLHGHHHSVHASGWTAWSVPEPDPPSALRSGSGRPIDLGLVWVDGPRGYGRHRGRSRRARREPRAGGGGSRSRRARARADRGDVAVPALGDLPPEHAELDEPPARRARSRARAAGCVPVRLRVRGAARGIRCAPRAAGARAHAGHAGRGVRTRHGHRRGRAGDTSALADRRPVRDRGLGNPERRPDARRRGRAPGRPDATARARLPAAR